jgi:cell division transport system permease protein
MKSWLNTHLQAFKLVTGRLRANALSTFLIALVVGVAISLPGLFYLGVDHIAKFSSSIQNENEISVFLKLETSAAAIKDIDAVLSDHPQIKQHKLISKQEAWDAMKAKLQDPPNDGNEDFLTENPLPDAFYIHANSNDPMALESLKKDLAQIPHVEHVLLNSDWAKRLASILAIAKKIILFVAFLLSIGLVIIIGNTIRMQILTQQDEIEVSYLIGATNSFIRTPFLYAGTLYGFFGGLIGIAIIALSIRQLNSYIATIANLYGTQAGLAFYDASLLGVVLFSAVATGWLGAYLTVNRAIAGIITAHKNRG